MDPIEVRTISFYFHHSTPDFLKVLQKSFCRVALLASYDLLNITEWVWKRNCFFLNGKEKQKWGGGHHVGTLTLFLLGRYFDLPHPWGEGEI